MDLFDGSTSEEDDGDTVGEVVAELARLVPPVGAVKPVIVVAPDVDGAYEDRARGAGFVVASPGAACDALVVHALGDAVAAVARGGAVAVVVVVIVGQGLIAFDVEFDYAVAADTVFDGYDFWGWRS